jgi:RNA polymerase sigma-70 factor (ECF subfamily)
MIPPHSTGPNGPGSRFEETQWTEIGRIPDADEQERQAILDDLCRRYWRPVYSYLRFRGQSHEDARDLTQAFFAEIVFGKDLISQADRSRGRFRTFLLTALNSFVHQEYRKSTAQKRMPRQGLFSLSDAQAGQMEVTSSAHSPQEAFTFAWAASLLEEVLEEVRQSCRADGLAVHWDLFEARVVDPMLHGQQSPELSQLCRKHGLEDSTQVSNMLVTVKRRFRTHLRSAVRRNLRPGEDVEEEIRELMKILSGSRAG